MVIGSQSRIYLESTRPIRGQRTNSKSTQNQEKKSDFNCKRLIISCSLSLEQVMDSCLTFYIFFKYKKITQVASSLVSFLCQESSEIQLKPKDQKTSSQFLHNIHSLNCLLPTPGLQVDRESTSHMRMTAHLWFHAKSPPDMQTNSMYIENTPVNPKTVINVSHC